MHNVIERFFACVARGDRDGALALVTDDAVFEAQGPSSVPIYGRYDGRDGVRRFLDVLAEMFDTEVFEIRQCAIADEAVFAFGFMQHRVRRTDAVFRCEWALVCRTHGGRIRSYKMFEDTDALRIAYA